MAAVAAAVFLAAAVALAALKPEGPTVFNQLPVKITVTSPAGGEEGNVGTKHDVTWTATGGTNFFVNIFLQKGSGPLVQVAWNAKNGLANCMIPTGTVPGSDYRVWVVSVDNPVVKGVSNTFTINAAPTFTVLSPNGGEAWHRGSTYDISWKYTGKPEKVTLLLVPYSNAVNFKTIAEVSPGANGVGSYAWKIPVDTERRTDYRIWLVYSTVTADMSNQNFSVIEALFTAGGGADLANMPDPITVYKPAGGAVVEMGKPHTVAWKPTLDMDLPGPVRVDVMQGEVVRATLSPAAGLPVTGSLVWELGTSEPGVDTNQQYRIRVRSKQNPKLQGFSGVFTLFRPRITITAPPNSSEIQRGMPFSIAWTPSGDCGTSVDLYIKTESGLEIVDTIETNVPLAQGLLHWVVPHYDDAQMDRLKPIARLVVQSHTNPDINGYIQVKVR
jgi:hypothetical protein